MPSREYFNSRRQARRDKFIQMLGGKCESCGETERLHFDHIDPKEKEFSISKRIDAPEDILIVEVKKCRLLCPKCHRSKTKENGEHGQPTARHGTLWMYKKYKCRCDKCRKAMSDYNRNKRLSALAALYHRIKKPR